MHPIQFLTFISFTAILVVGIVFPFPASLLPALFVFVGISVMDFIIGVDPSNPGPEEEILWKRSSFWMPQLYLYSVTHFIILFFAGFKTSTASWNEVFLLALNVGLYTGGLGITVAHELCHKKESFPRIVGDLLLCSVWYQHFSVEHVKGHHFMVSTPEDPASARKGESCYSFLLRSLKGSFVHAFELDRRKVLFGIILSLIFTALAAFFGLKVLVFFLLQSIVAFILLELVNYIEHYGLERRKLPSGRYEKVLPQHSWNSSHKFSNLLLFNLQRHSDHHALAHLPYTVLKHHDRAPQLPMGYPGMILLALIPPLWFKVMDARVEAFSLKLN